MGPKKGSITKQSAHRWQWIGIEATQGGPWPVYGCAIQPSITFSIGIMRNMHV